jgi:hypothetical protein
MSAAWRWSDLLHFGEEPNGATWKLEAIELQGDQEVVRGPVPIECTNAAGYDRALGNPFPLPVINQVRCVIF